jgi:NADH-quinone oxidoreductase subunit J
MLAAVPIAAKVVPVSEVATWNAPRIFFWAVLGTLVLGGALMTITRRNAVAAVMSLVATFFGLAATYALLSAHFLAAVQVLVYAGAIMVLFIFVVMVLNRDEAEPWAWRGVIMKSLIGVPAVVYLTVKLSYHLAQWVPDRADPPSPEFGTVANVGELLFTDYLFAFEAVSILLLIAVIAAVVVARAHRAEDDVTPQEGAAPAGAHPPEEAHG